MHLTDREEAVLTTIIEEFISSASPVGSRTVAKRSKLNLSPATIRNIMSDLLDDDFLEQPHTSAGRAPTFKAFRYYIDHILKLKPLTVPQKQTIVSYFDQQDIETSEILRKASKILSEFSQQISIVVAPDQDYSRWKNIDFVMIKPGMILSVLVLDGGMVKTKVLNTSSDIESEDLVRFRNYLNDLFQGKTIADARVHIIRELQQAREQFNQLYQKALNLADQTFQEDVSRELIIDGQMYVLDQPDFTDLGALKELYRVIEERSKLLDLLDQSTGKGGVSVCFSEEEPEETPGKFGIISSPYTGGEEPLGSIGIIGPMRMNYSIMVPVVDFTAQMLSKAIKQRL